MTHDIWTSSSLHELSDEDLKSFQEIVVKDTKNHYLTNDEKAILSHNLDLWLFCLRNLRKEVELKLSHRKVNIKSDVRQMRSDGVPESEVDEYLIEAHKYRNSIIKFLTAIERKTLYVKLLIEEEK